MEGNANLDAIDFAILEALQKNARLSNKELAAEVGLAQSSCLARVTRLRETGVLKSFHAEVRVRPQPRAPALRTQGSRAARGPQRRPVKRSRKRSRAAAR